MFNLSSLSQYNKSVYWDIIINKWFLQSVQSLPLLKSTQECDQILSTDGRVEETVCHEIHLFRPFAKDKNGAMTEVIQTLKFVTEKRGGQIIQGTFDILLYVDSSNNVDIGANRRRE